ncbi:MAG: hypothetical protein EBS39_07825 [Gammaproteobacteria bacterium]|nr:hypothetical protein [Gammaproteobacteria bacterium]
MSVLGSTVHRPKAGEVVFRRDDYTNSFYTILEGSVEIEVGEEDATRRITLEAGQFFGEGSLLSGRRRSATVHAGRDCTLIESPRRDIMKLMNSVEAVRAVVDRLSVLRAIQTGFAPGVPLSALEPIASRAKLNRYKSDERLFTEGDDGDTLHLIRRGSVSVSRQVGGREVVVSYVAAGNTCC